MSNHYDIKCLDCEGHPGAGWWWNHGEKRLGEILDALPLVVAAWPFLNSGLVDGFQIGFADGGSHVESVRFLVEHASHRLAVISEYGSAVSNNGMWKVREPGRTESDLRPLLLRAALALEQLTMSGEAAAEIPDPSRIAATLERMEAVDLARKIREVLGRDYVVATAIAQPAEQIAQGKAKLP